MKIVKMLLPAILLAGFLVGAAAAQDMDDVLAALLVNPQLSYTQTTEDLAADNGAGILGAAGQAVAEGVMFSAGAGENPLLTFAQSISGAPGMQDNANRAFLMAFVPSAKDFGFMFFTEDNIGLTIGPNSEPMVFALADNYMQPLDTALRIEPGSAYNILLAATMDGRFRGALWQDGAAAQAAYFTLDLTAFENGNYHNQPWEVLVGFAGEATLTVTEYAYYSFDGFAD